MLISKLKRKTMNVDDDDVQSPTRFSNFMQELYTLSKKDDVNAVSIEEEVSLRTFD